MHGRFSKHQEKIKNHTFLLKNLLMVIIQYKIIDHLSECLCQNMQYLVPAKVALDNSPSHDITKAFWILIFLKGLLFFKSDLEMAHYEREQKETQIWIVTNRATFNWQNSILLCIKYVYTNVIPSYCNWEEKGMIIIMKFQASFS